MRILALLSLFNSTVIVLFGEYVFLQNRKNILNKLFALICIDLGFWAFCEFMYRQTANPQIASLWIRILALAWPFSTALMLHFALIFTEKTAILKHKLTYFLMYFPAVVISIIDLTTEIISNGPVKHWWGFSFAIPKYELPYLLSSNWVFFLGVVTLVFFWHFYFTTTNLKKKEQTIYIGIGFVFLVFAAGITEILLPSLNIRIPELMANFFTMLAVLVGYAIVRYELFAISPANAADKIISTMTDSLVIIDPQGNISNVNKSTLDMLNYREDELLGYAASILFVDKEKMRNFLARVLAEDFPVKNYETQYRKKSGQTVPVLFSTSIIKDKRGDIAGAVGVATDVTELKEAEEARGIADYLQEALLKVPGEIKGIDFGHLYAAATEATGKVGGDFYDLFEMGHQNIGIVLGDVSGKGLEAATLTSLVRNAIKAYSSLEESAASIMAKTNELVIRFSEPKIFVTVFFGILNIESGELIYCNAGHPPPIIRSKFQKASFLETNSTVIGVFKGQRYFDNQALLMAGDILTLYSDGVTEARCFDGFFGEERLIETIKDLKTPSTSEVPKAIFRKTIDCTGGKLTDDIVLLAVSIEKK